MPRSLTVDRGLTRKLLEHLGGTGEPVTRLANGNVEDELLDLQILHGVLGFGRHRESSEARERAGGGSGIGRRCGWLSGMEVGQSAGRGNLLRRFFGGFAGRVIGALLWAVVGFSPAVRTGATDPIRKGPSAESPLARHRKFSLSSALMPQISCPLRGSIITISFGSST